MKTVLVLALLVSLNALATPEVIKCKNPLNKSSFTMVRDAGTFSSLIVRLDGMNNTISNDFTYTAKDLRALGSTVVFEKARISRSEVMIQEVTPGQILGMITFQYLRYDSATETVLMTCSKF